ncbi:uncharacterized protein LOC113465875 [Diaphorina citri]|uniref:Uncharacterized protein LOC113465875 n=1 Tax=Diaphorina citri TaxID=121845 RepID=A0A3Q0IPK7_DIACI|nr:uncharacterized protein LOC113465875 [Diaphorina citri]
MQMMPLRHSPSAGGLLGPGAGTFHPPSVPGLGLLQHSGSGPAIQHSTSGILHTGKHKVHFSGPNLTSTPVTKDKSKKVSITLQNNVDFKTLRAGLQRSKSLSAANEVKEDVPDIGKFPAEVQQTINQAVKGKVDACLLSVSGTMSPFISVAPRSVRLVLLFHLH